MKTVRTFLLCGAAMVLAAAAPVLAKEKSHDKTVTYLGVGTTPVDPLLARHLKIAPGTGLLVRMVDEQSAAQGLIEPEDILTELDGQILINHEQFQTLVRMKKPGSEARVVLRRDGAEKTVTVKLGERTVPPEESMDQPWSTVRPWDPLSQQQQLWEDLQRRMPNHPPLRNDDTPGRGKSAPRADVNISTQSHIMIDRDGMKAELSDNGSERTFKVTAPKGKVLFDGPVTDEAVNKMTPEVRSLYDEVADKTHIEIRTLDNHDGGQPARHKQGDA